MDQLTHEDRRRELDAGDTADVFALLIARRRLVVPFLVLGVVGALVVSFLIPPRYVATVTILPRQGGTSLPFLQNLAMFNLPSSVQGNRWKISSGGSSNLTACSSQSSPHSGKTRQGLGPRVICGNYWIYHEIRD